MTEKMDQAAMRAALEEARGALSKLPILGPALWLYARDPLKKYLFIGNVDWALLPPIVLDQCRLYTKDGLPYAFVTWALVNDQIDARLRSGQPRIAPHEWQTGEHLWIIDAVAPFGQREETLDELRETMFPWRKISALWPSSEKAGAVQVREWPATAAPARH